MLIVEALNVTGGTGEDSDGLSDYDCKVLINRSTIFSGMVVGHIRKSGASELLRRIADEMDGVSSKAAEAPGGQAAGDFLLAHPDYEKWPRRSSSLITTLDDIQFDWRTVVKLMQDYAELPAPAAPSERTDGRKEAVNRLAKFIAQKESFNCKTLDESLHHQSKWKRIIPEAEELLNAAFPVSSQEGK